MTLTVRYKEKVEEIIKIISITELDYSKSIDDCLINVDKLIELKSQLELVKSDSRFFKKILTNFIKKRKEKITCQERF